jgi:methylation protein EvaC
MSTFSPLGNSVVSGRPLIPILDLGRMPIANGFLSPDQFNQEYFFHLWIGQCPDTSLVQLGELVPPEKMFHDAYPFFTSSSVKMTQHFHALAAQLGRDHLGGKKDPLVVELGSNDGTFLEMFKKRQIRHLGIEPSRNVAEASRQKGVQALDEFFSQGLASRLLKELGPADLICGFNVICHIPNLVGLLAGISLWLREEGVFVFEDPYFGKIAEINSFDQIYDEHVFYFSVTSVREVFERNGLRLVNAEPQETHGGSMRYTLQKGGDRPPAPAVAEWLEREKVEGLHLPSCHEKFRRKVEKNRDDLRSCVKGLAAEKKTVWGYAATSKSTTTLNYAGLGPEDIPCIVDSTPLKQGKFSPGMHIPIRPSGLFRDSPPSHALLLGWNHRKEILETEKGFGDRGGLWIEYVPTVRIT